MSRAEYMRNEGFALSTDIGHQIFIAAQQLAIREVQPSDYQHLALQTDPSAGALAAVAMQLQHTLRGYIRGDSSFDERYHVTAEDREGPKNQFNFEKGLADFEFTWYFAPAIAWSVADHFRQAGYMTSVEQAKLTLGQWADLMRRPWFHDLLHDMALTGSGLLGAFGPKTDDYLSDGLQRSITGQGHPIEHVFDISLQTDDITGRAYPIVRLTDEMRQMLRGHMRRKESPGCPVAHHTGAVVLGLVDTDDHLRRLIVDGHLTIVAQHEQHNLARFTQAVTPIDRAVNVLADKLDAYDGRYGTPYLYQASSSPDWYVKHDQPKRGVRLIRRLRLV